MTPKRSAGRQLRPAAPTLFVIAILIGVAVYRLSQGRDAATLNNVAFAALQVAILGHGVAAAVAPSLAAVATTSGGQADEAAA